MDNYYDIFISYRRLDENGKISGRDQARLISKQLELAHFHPFFDYSEIKDGEFDKVILPAIENCKVFVLVLTKDSLNRCRNADDWVRREIETALDSGCKIINVSPDNSFNGWPDNLPNSIQKIKTIQISIVYFDSLFEKSMKKLVNERILPVVSSKRRTISHENSDDGFREICESLYFILVDVRYAFQTADQEKVLIVVPELQQLMGKVYSIFELNKYSNIDVSNKAKNLVDQFNEWVPLYNKFIDSNRVSENAQIIAKEADEEFSKLVDIVVKYNLSYPNKKE